MPRNTRKTTHIVVHLLDTSEVCADALTIAPADAEVCTTRKWGIVLTPEGVYALCDEGVGPAQPVTDEDPLAMDFWWRGDGLLSMFPFATANIGPDDLRAMAERSGELELLDRFIRTFGARLDANYEGWRTILERAVAL